MEIEARGGRRRWLVPVLVPTAFALLVSPLPPPWRIGAALLLAGTALALWLRLTALQARLDHAQRRLDRSLAGTWSGPLRIARPGDAAALLAAVDRLIERCREQESLYRKREHGRKQLLASISHDIRTPLTAIIGYIDALSDGIAADPAEEAAYLEILRRKARLLKQRIDDLFLLARIDADELEMKPEWLDLGECTREVLLEFTPRIHQTGLALEVQIPAEPLPVTADRGALERVLRNLIVNALEHGQDGSFLGVAVRAEEQGTDVCIRDRGKGIAAADLPQLFQRIHRSGKTGAQAVGTGLGLFICHSLTTRMGGTISVHSVAGQETVFTVRLPRQRPAAMESTRCGRNPASPA